MALPLAVVVFLLPGFTWVLLSGLLKRLNMFGTVAFSFMLSVCLLSVTSAFLSLLTSRYLIYTIAGAAILSTIAVAAYFWQRGFGKPLTEGVSVAPLLLLCLVVYVVLLLVFFWSTPYYPTTSDPLTHAQVTQSISSGDGRSVLLHANFPVGLPFVAAILMTLLGTNALQSLGVLVSLVLLTSLVLIFVSAKALFGKENLAALTTLVGAFILPVDAMHLVLIGTYPNLVDDAIVFAAVFLLFSYVREPSFPVGVTLALAGLGGVFMHSSFLLFLAALWLLLPAMFLLFRGKGELNRYFRGCLYSTVGIFLVALVTLPLLKGNLTRVFAGYSIISYLSGETPAQLLQSLMVVYETLAWNLVVLIKPLTLIAIVLGLILVAKKGGQSIGQVFAACWLAILLILSFLTPTTDRFVLFCMIPSIFLVGNLVGNIPFPEKTRLRMVNRRVVVAGVLILLVAFGGFLPLIPVAFNPSRRLHEQDIYASMEWLEQNRCPSGVASLGLDFDFRYLPILTNVQYSGSLPSATNSDQVLQESRVMGFGCVVMQTDNTNLHSFEVNQAFQERYRNTEVAIFFIMS